MEQVNSSTLHCRRCDREIFRKRPVGRIPLYCDECKVIVARERAREHEAKVKAGYTPPTTFSCMDCEREFPRGNLGPLVRRCEDCKIVFEEERARRRRELKYGALREQFETEGRWTNCETCQRDIRVPSQKGPAPRWCDPCRNARQRELEKATRPWARVGECIECGGPTSRETADKRRDMCPRCFDAQRDGQGRWINKVSQERREIALKFGPTAARLMGPWNDRYIPYEIYVRDRWVCQVCSGKVDPELRHPDRMSASLDHVIPRSQDGHDYRANVRLAHKSCNSSRNNRGGNEQLALLG